MLPLLMIVLCVVFRIVPHPANFVPVGATAVFSGRTLPGWAAVWVTLVAMIVSDYALSRLHGYPLFSAVTPFVYAGFALQTFLGRRLRNRRGGAVYAAAAGSALFFLISNFGVWAAGWYGHTASGLVACYTAAIPFYGATFASDMAWTLILTLSYAPLSRWLSSRPGWVPLIGRTLPAV
ncbi:MAG: DUF6580 family putative transport protein [Pseudomonadota bacterium]